jgi:hypothetical protein
VAQKLIYTIAPTIGQKRSYPTVFPTPIPSLPPTLQPAVAEGSVCITVTIGTSISQEEWINDNAIAAMKEALAISMGVPIDAINVNYANQLCQASPTFSPTRGATGNRRILAMGSIVLPPVVPSHRNYSVLDYDTKMSIVHIADHGQISHQLQFSVVIQLSGT